MGRQDRTQNKQRLAVHDIFFFAAGILLTLTMLSVWLVSGMYAKYVIRDTVEDAARVASAGTVEIELFEHEATLSKGEYHLNYDNEVTGNDYEKVIPGVDLPKDPIIRFSVSENAEVDYELYLEVKESKNFPPTVTYEISDDWEPVEGKDGVYKYTGKIEKGKKYEIRNILVGNKLLVSEHFVGDKSFTLSFNAWLGQVRSDG